MPPPDPAAALRARADNLLTIVAPIAAELRTWGVDESAVDYINVSCAGRTWLLVHLGDLVRDLLAALAQAAQERDEALDKVQRVEEMRAAWRHDATVEMEARQAAEAQLAAVTAERDEAKALLNAVPLYGERYQELSLPEHIVKTIEDRNRIGRLLGDFAEQILPEDRLGIELANERADNAETALRTLQRAQEGLTDIHREICICAAILLADGRVIRGHRHDDCIHTAEKWHANRQAHIQGFVTSAQRFVTRHEAMALQKAAGIASATDYRGDTLFSEDLY